VSSGPREGVPRCKYAERYASNKPEAKYTSGAPACGETAVPAVERLRQAGADAQTIEYARAHHGFDRPRTAPARRNPNEQNASRCFWKERPEGHLVNRDTGQPFSPRDPCVTRGGISGPDPAAYRAALRAVKALVGTARPSP
jgi:hypothetical protein